MTSILIHHCERPQHHAQKAKSSLAIRTLFSVVRCQRFYRKDSKLVKVKRRMSWLASFFVLMFFIGSVYSGCLSDKDCGTSITIGNKTISFRTGVCCVYVSPKRCMSHSECYIDNSPWKWWTSKPISPTPKTNYRPSKTWKPWTYKIYTRRHPDRIPRWTDFPLFTYQPTYSPKDEESTSVSGVTEVLLISLVAIFIVILPLAIFYRRCFSRNRRRPPQQTSQRFSTGQNVERERSNPHDIVMVITSDELPSYQDALQTSSPPRYEDLPPPPRYEDVVNEHCTVNTVT